MRGSADKCDGCALTWACETNYPDNNPPCFGVADNSASTNTAMPKLPDELVILTDAYLADKEDSISVADDILRKWKKFYSR